MQFDGEKPDKITRGACACNDDKVIFENPLNWTTRRFKSPITALLLDSIFDPVEETVTYEW